MKTHPYPTYQAAHITLHRAVYTPSGWPCILVKGYMTGMCTAYFVQGKVKVLHRFENEFEIGALLDEYSNFTGTIERGYIDGVLLDEPPINKKRGILVVPDGGTHAWCYYPEGEVTRAKAPQPRAVLGKPPKEGVARMPRKELKTALHEAMLRTATAEADLEEVSKVAASRLAEIATLCRTRDELRDALEDARKTNAERKARLLAAIDQLENKQ